MVNQGFQEAEVDGGGRSAEEEMKRWQEYWGEIRERKIRMIVTRKRMGEAQEMERRGERVGRDLLKGRGGRVGGGRGGQESEGKDQEERRETRWCKGEIRGEVEDIEKVQ